MTLSLKDHVELAQTQAEVEGEIGFTPPRTGNTPLEILGGAKWASHYYPHLFGRPFTVYQQDYWQWIDTIEPNQYSRPRVECDPRGVGKSTNAEVSAVKLIATQKRRMIGYVSLNEEKAGKHFSTIKSMLESDKLLQDYPHCKPKIQKLRDTAESWSRDAIVTESDAMVVPLTLLGSSRGWKSSIGIRFDLIFLDDIDALGQSADFTKKLIELLKGEILAAGDDNTVVIVPQNLIYRDSICTQILDHRADILSDRIFCGPFPLLKNYEAEKRDIEGDATGGKEWVITTGEAFDPAISIEYANKLLNKFGKATFDRECQQEVFKVDDDKDFREWNEVYHLITYSEFRAAMEATGEDIWNDKRQRLQIPTRWNVGIGLDWGTTKGHPTGAAFVARPPEISPFHKNHFAFAEVIKPKFPIDSFEDAEQVSPGRVASAVQRCLNWWNVIESQIQMRLMSHEASAALATMAIDLKDEVKQFFGKWKPRRGSGVPQVQNLLEIDHTKSHPFRRYPDGYKLNGVDVGGLPVQGRPRMFWIVPDEQGDLCIDSNGRLYVRGAKDASGFARARFEMPLYSYKNSGDKKIDDDYVDGLLGLMNVFGASPDGKTFSEEFQIKYESQTQYAAGELAKDTSISAQMSRSMALGKARKAMKADGWEVDEYGEAEGGSWEPDLSGGY